MNHVVSQVGLCTTQTLHDKAENHEMLWWVLTVCCMIFNLGPYCILLTILNKSGSLELYLSGVWSEVFDMNFACRVPDPFLCKMWCTTKQTLIVQKVIDTHTRKPMSLSIHLIHPFSGTILVFDMILWYVLYKFSVAFCLIRFWAAIHIQLCAKVLQVRVTPCLALTPQTQHLDTNFQGKKCSYGPLEYMYTTSGNLWTIWARNYDVCMVLQQANIL